jgi:cellobiose phosphorylase
MYRATLESILGFKLENNTLSINPSIPKEWPKFTITYRFKSSTYNIEVLNNQASSAIQVDGKSIDGKVIHLVDDGMVHEVTIFITIESL